MSHGNTKAPRGTGSTTEEHYVEAIGALEEQGTPVGTAAIAQSLGLSMPSVSEMLVRLAANGLVSYAPYSGATLADNGKRLFASLVRRHRLWEVFLNRCLGCGWEEVYPPACALEHATSDAVIERMAEFLGHPETCPHGAPIPSADGEWPEARGRSLSEMQDGKTVRIVRVLREDDADCLQFLTDRGIVPGATLRVLDIAEFDGTVTLEVEGTIRAIGRDVASRLRVEPDQAPA
jgi:DtxR family Mn-dependent transcriptional regulator